jgi:hypothetical protein
VPELEKSAGSRGSAHRGMSVQRVALLAMGLFVVSALAGPAAYSVQTINSAHAGALPSAGPAAMRGDGGGGRGIRQQGQNDDGTRAAPPAQGGGMRTRGGGGMGGFLGGGGTTGVASELVTLLQQGASGYTWAAAAITANGASPLQLASGEPVMAIGGFNGTDPSPTLAEFQELVAQGKVHYFVGSGGGPGGGGGGGGERGTSTEISTWVAETFEAQTVGTATVYDLTAG